MSLGDCIAVDPGFGLLIEQYDRWRQIYSSAGTVPRDKPVWVDGRLNLRNGYPHPGWTSFIVQPAGDGYDVVAASTERRIEPLEALRAHFSCLDDTGKYIIWNIGEDLRVACRILPLTGRGVRLDWILA